MGKKNRQPFAPSVAPASPMGMAEQAVAELAARRFRKARDLFKLLCKQDREKFLPGLIAANRGLAEELMAKGQVSEAEQVIAYLKTITPAGELLGMDVLAAQRAQDWPRAWRLAVDWWTSAKGALTPRDRTTVADALVLAFPNLETAGASVPEALCADLAAILAALRALSEERFAEAQDALRPVPRGSLFADWKMLVKGWLALHAGDRAKAAQLLDAVAPDSTPSRAAEALRPFLSPVQMPAGPGQEAPLGRTCRLLGEPALGPILARADHLWRAGRHFASWQEMRRANGFPSESPTIHGALSDFYSRVLPTLNDDDADAYVDGLLDFATKRSFKNPAERRLVCRILATDSLEALAPESAEEWWREFVDACPPDDPRTDRLAALAFAHLGHWMAQPYDLDPFRMRGPGSGLRDLPGAIDNLQQAIERDPGHLPAYLDLLRVYEHEKNQRDHQRLLETMTQRFPEDKAVLFQAGRHQLQGGAFAKGLELLERAHALDRLDPATQCEIVRGLFLLARQQYGKKALAPARATLARLEQYAVRDGIDFARGLDLLQARSAALEMVFGEESASRAQLAVARSTTRTPAALLLLTHVVYRANGNVPPKQGPFWKELKPLRAETVAERALLLQVLDHASQLNGTLDWKAEANFVRDCLAPVAGAAFSRDEALILHISLMGRRGFEKFMKELVKAGLRHDGTDPRFLLLKELSLKRRDGWIDRYKIGHLRQEAVRRGDQKAVALADSALNRPPPSQFEEDDFIDDDDFGDDIPFGADLGPAIGPGFSPDPFDLASSMGLEGRAAAARRYRQGHARRRLHAHAARASAHRGKARPRAALGDQPRPHRGARREHLRGRDGRRKEQGDPRRYRIAFPRHRGARLGRIR